MRQNAEVVEDKTEKSEYVTLTIDGIEVKARKGTPLLEVARQIGVEIPTLCYYSFVSPYGSCRLCSVEITTKSGRNRIVTSCNYPAEDGLKVETKSEKVIMVRKGILELLLARCPKVVRVKNLAREYGITEPTLWVSDQDEDCILCGLCVRACKELIGVSAINFAMRGVKREITAPYHKFSDDCIGCGVCALVCPTGSRKIRQHTYATIAPLKGPKDENIGVNIDIFSAHSPDSLDGFVKAVIAAGLKSGLLDSVVLAKRKNSFAAEAVIIENSEDFLNCSLANSVRIKIVSTLMDAIAKGKRKIAFIGLPCQVRAARKIEQTLQKEIPDLEITSIGLFCLNSFNPKKLVEKINSLFKVDEKQIENISVKDGKFIIQAKSKEHSVALEKLDAAIENGCVYCNDFPAFFADLAIGTAGSEPGSVTVIVRTDKGKMLLEKANFTRDIAQKDDVVRLSDFKKNRAKEHTAPILKEIYAQRSRKGE
ncbi:MAG: Coenzyme F420 hydrogenase/dehydrogenase, beta subunit C-terminal domain [Candidatus Bathyarchaeota archaeon]|nr:Coenzyme F420 hydrogenase/dehydrogenase, beta subunit C-terminal domain [Candidatus Bathyarchaeota archaeon]